MVVADARSILGYELPSELPVDGTAVDAGGRFKTYVVGRDDVRQIPPASYVYLTRAARRRLGAVAIAGRMLPTERAFSEDTVREVLGIVV